MIWRLYQNEVGQDIIEYGLLASFVSIVAVVTIKLLGPLIIVLYESVYEAILEAFS
jgi:Flp pilus assembly pilin Flp